MHLPVLQAVSYREFVHVEQVAESFNFRFWMIFNLPILETVGRAELFHSSIACHAHVALLQTGSCVLLWLGVVEIWKVSMSEPLLA